VKKRAVLGLSKQDCLSNYTRIRQQVQSTTKLMAVVKSNAYGCGVDLMVPFLKELGINYFAVATTEESREVAQLDAETPILLLSEPLIDNIELLPDNIELTVYTEGLIEYLINHTPNRHWKLHLKVNTGLNRLGAGNDLFWALWSKILEADNLECVGVMSHLIESDEKGSTRTSEQVGQFKQIVDRCKLESPAILAHISNSAALKLGPDLEFDMVRLGLALYDKALSLETIVLHTQSLAAGDTVSYQQLFKATEPCQIAILSMGYADGIPTITQNATVMIHQKQYPIVGRICMDMVCVNLGKDSCQAGDIATLFNPQKPHAPLFKDWLTATKQNPREFTCGLGQRVGREWR